MKSRALYNDPVFFRNASSRPSTITWEMAGGTTKEYWEYIWENIMEKPPLTQYYSGSSIFENFAGSESFSSTRFERPRFNACDHHKWRTFVNPSTFTVDLWGGPFSLYDYAPKVSNIYLTNPVRVGKHPNVNLHQAQTTAWHTMQPRFEGNISMFNFLIELKDMRSLLQALRSKPLRKIRNFLYKKKKKIDPTKPIAQTYLANEFALKPLLADISTITQQIESKITEVQQNFADAGREISSRHYSETFVFSQSDDRSSTDKSRTPWAPSGHCYKMQFTATMEHSYKYNMRSTLDAFIKYWGLGSTREAIWNAIPFSFVLDYFINLGDCIRLTEHDKNVGLKLHQYCESFLTTYEAGAFVDPSLTYDGVVSHHHGADVTDSSYHLLAGIRSSLYSRRPCSPNYGIVVPRIKKLSSKQKLNLAALLRGFF